MSLADDLLIILTDYSGGYRLMRRRMLYSTPPNSNSASSFNYTNIKDDTLKSTLSRLKREGMVGNKNGIWKITKRGREFLAHRLKFKIFHFAHLKIRDGKKKMIVVFDIPERYRKRRDWLRLELASLGFSQLQKSVWMGPAPLPKEFIEYLNNIDILVYLKFFSVTKEGII